MKSSVRSRDDFNQGTGCPASTTAVLPGLFDGAGTFQLSRIKALAGNLSGTGNLLRLILLPTLVSALVACSNMRSPVTVPAGEKPDANRYSIQQDRAPEQPVDIAGIPEVIPTTVSRSLAGNHSPYWVLGKSYTVMPSEMGYLDYGTASWYGEKFHGHRTSNGEVFDMYKASAAHRSLPIPSFLRVTNLENNRSIVVRVNDRGPFHGDRLIDLSYAAAMKLGYADQGIAPVQLEAIVVDSAPADSADGLLWPDSAGLPSTDSNQGGKFLQVGAFSSLNNAQRISRQLSTITSRPVFIRSTSSTSNRVLHRVRIGPLINHAEIHQLSQRVVAAGLGSPYTVVE